MPAAAAAATAAVSLSVGLAMRKRLEVSKFQNKLNMLAKDTSHAMNS